MSYLNNQLGYRDALLDTRSIIKKGDYIVLDPDGLVKNVVPGYENCDVTILGSPAMGATFEYRNRWRGNRVLLICS